MSPCGHSVTRERVSVLPRTSAKIAMGRHNLGSACFVQNADDCGHGRSDGDPQKTIRLCGTKASELVEPIGRLATPQLIEEAARQQSRARTARALRASRSQCVAVWQKPAASAQRRPANRKDLAQDPYQFETLDVYVPRAILTVRMPSRRAPAALASNR